MLQTLRGTLEVLGGVYEKVHADPLPARVGATMVAIDRSSLPSGIGNGDEVIVVPADNGMHQITRFFSTAVRCQ